MYRFMKTEGTRHEASVREIRRLEEKYGIQFPKVLTEFYDLYDEEEMKETLITVDGYEMQVSHFIPILSEYLRFEELADWEREDQVIPANLYAFAGDDGGNYYYFDADKGGVWFIAGDDADNPWPVAESVEKFFIHLNALN